MPTPITSIAIAFSGKRGPVFRYHATSGDHAWSGAVAADAVEAAVIDVINDIRCDGTDIATVRFVVSLPARSPLWRYATEISALLPGVTVEMPTSADLPLMKAAQTAAAPAPAPPPDTEPMAPDLSPVWVATDGSVRGTFTGSGWLASTGDYGLRGFRHSKKQVGPKVVLISELRAIGERRAQFAWPKDHRAVRQQAGGCHGEAMMDGDEVLPKGYNTERAHGKRPGPGGRPAVDPRSPRSAHPGLGERSPKGAPQRGR